MPDTALSLLVLLLAGCATTDPAMVVMVAAVDLRATPHTSAQPGVHDPGEETQLLYGERVRALQTQDGWSQVEALEQPEFTHQHRWQGYPGWVPASALMPEENVLSPTAVVTVAWARGWQDPYRLRPSPLSFPLGTRLHAQDLDKQLWQVERLDGKTVWLPHEALTSLADLETMPAPEKRRRILRSASLLMGDLYYWGGRTPASERTDAEPAVTGIDCSGLVNLAYRAAGLDLPRDAHEQFLRARRVNAVQPADLVFLSERNNPAHIVHVMLYAGDGMLLEAPGTGQTVRTIAVAERLGTPLDWLEPGVVVHEQTVFFGTYFESPSTKFQAPNKLQ